MIIISFSFQSYVFGAQGDVYFRTKNIYFYQQVLKKVYKNAIFSESSMSQIYFELVSIRKIWARIFEILLYTFIIYPTKKEAHHYDFPH